MALHNWFLPHKDTHKKAHLISPHAILAYALLFILLQVGFSIFSFYKPGVLGINSGVDLKKVIELTNIERAKAGLSPVSENSELDKAAQLKAANMFEENYWAHFAPSGKTPWDFILGSGYRFTLAGENLAKNFQSSDEVVTAWMNSKTHRDNLLNSNYKDIGVAVVDGVLNGQKTTVVVQEFGTTEALAQKPSIDVSGKQIAVPQDDFSKPLILAATGTKLNIKSIFNPYQFSKYAGLTVLSLIVFLLALDLLVLYRRRVFRNSSHHLAHMALLSLAAGSLLLAGPGAVL